MVFPDIVFSMMGTRMRLDDMFAFFILFLSLINRTSIKKYSKFYSQVVFWYVTFAIFCFSSFLVVFLYGLDPEMRTLLRMIGCMVIFLGLTRVLRDQKVYRAFVWGSLLGFIAIMIQVVFKWKTFVVPMLNTYDTYWHIKKAVSFETWNPNSIGNYALMFAFIFGISKFGVKSLYAKIFTIGAILASLLPIFIFARAATLSIFLAWSLIVLLLKKNRWISVLALLIILFVLFSFMSDHALLFNKAVDVNILTGKGIGLRLNYWITAGQLFLEHPFIGHGFGLERILYYRIWNGGMSHNAFFSVLIECGLFGFILFMGPLCIILKKCLRDLLLNYDFKKVICFSFFIGMLFLSLSQSELYWYKSSFLMLAVIVISLDKKDNVY